jgi:hypothetical protein
MLENSKRKGEKFPALPTAWAKAVGKSGLSPPVLPALPTALAQAVGKDGLPLEARVGFANSIDRCCWQTKLLAKLSFSLPTGLCQQSPLPCWRR